MNRREGLTEEKRQARRAERHESRTSSTYKRFLHELSAATSLPEDQAERAAVMVAGMLEERILGGEARHFAAQLPAKLRELLASAEHEGLPRTKSGRAELFDAVERALELEGKDVQDIVCGVCAVLADWVAHGEVVKVVHGLPRDLRELWPNEIQLAVEAKHQREREAGRAVRDAERGLSPPVHQAPPRAELSMVGEHILALPPAAQLGILRMVLPKVLAPLTDAAREGFLRDLLDELGRAEDGERTYEFRADVAPRT